MPQPQLLTALQDRLKNRGAPVLLSLRGMTQETIYSASAVWNSAITLRHEWRNAGARPGALIASRHSGVTRLVELLAAMMGGHHYACLPPDHQQMGFPLHQNQQLFTTTKDGGLKAHKHNSSFPPIQENGGLLLLTSGTTGAKHEGKWVWHSWSNLLHQLHSHQEVMQLRPDTFRLCSLPSHHGFGLVLDQLLGLYSGQNLVLAAGLNRHCLKIIETYSIEHLALVPRQLQFLLTLLKNPNSQALTTPLRLHVGGAPVTARLQHTADELGVELCEGYGLTELGPGVSLDGKAVGCEIKLRPGPGQWREILVRSPSQGTVLDCATKLDDQGFFATGDLGRWQPCGRLQIGGRCTSLLKSASGEWLTLEKLEEALVQSFPIQECAITWSEKNSLQVVVVLDCPAASVTLGHQIRQYIHSLTHRDSSTHFILKTRAEFQSLLETARGKSVKDLLLNYLSSQPGPS